MPEEWEYQSRTFEAGKNSRFGLLLFTFFLIASILGFGVGARQQSQDMNSLSTLFGSDLLGSSANTSISDSWKQSDFTDFPLNLNFQYQDDETASCQNSTAVGCGLYQIISKYDCASVDGAMYGKDDSGMVQEIVSQSVSGVSSGQPFPMEFDLNESKSTTIELASLTCNS